MSDELLVKRLCDIDEGLTPWEVDFIESVTKQVERKEPLTWKQRSVAEQILEDKG